jgi:hypothetical protein
MAIASITQWLNDPRRSYSHGRALYEQYGDNSSLLALIRTGSGSFHQAKLREGLEKVNQKTGLQPRPIQIPVYIPVPVASPGKQNVDLKDAPEKIREIRDQKNKEYAQARHLFVSIRLMDSQQQRLQAGLELLDLMDRVNEAWSVIDEWNETGKVMELKRAESEKEVAGMTLPELLKERQNLPTYISKAKRKLEAAGSDIERLKLKLNLEAKEQRLQAVKKRIDEIIG